MTNWILLASLLVIAPAKAEKTEAAQSYSIPLLHWSSKHEKGVYGYIIYRASRANGPFLRINKRVVPAVRSVKSADATVAAQPNRYEFKDETADPAQTYYYYVDVISTTGLKQGLTQPVRRDPRPVKN